MSHFQNISDLAAMPLLLLLLSLLGILISPINNMISRYHEKQADHYALRNSKSPQAFIGAMEKLANINLADKEPHPVVEFLFHSHPSLASRIKMAQTFRKEK